MENQKVLNYKYSNTGVKEVFPANEMVSNWVFTQETEDEALLANAMACVAKKTGVNVNTLRHLFPAVLRMLKSDCNWAK